MWAYVCCWLYNDMMNRVWLRFDRSKGIRVCWVQFLGTLTTSYITLLLVVRRQQQAVQLSLAACTAAVANAVLQLKVCSLQQKHYLYSHKSWRGINARHLILCHTSASCFGIDNHLQPKRADLRKGARPTEWVKKKICEDRQFP